jgi:hypothetical protein
MERVRAVSAHEIADRAPIRMGPGDRVTIGKRDPDWPAFVFVTTPTGSGWVPSRHLSADAGEAEVLTGYDTTELPTAVGQVLEVVERDDESGWLWCRAEGVREGWVPVRTLEPIAPEPT